MEIREPSYIPELTRRLLHLFTCSRRMRNSKQGFSKVMLNTTSSYTYFQLQVFMKHRILVTMNIFLISESLQIIWGHKVVSIDKNEFMGQIPLGANSLCLTKINVIWKLQVTYAVIGLVCKVQTTNYINCLSGYMLTCFPCIILSFSAQQSGSTAVLVRSVYPMNKSSTCSAWVHYDKLWTSYTVSNTAQLSCRLCSSAFSLGDTGQL